MIKTYAHHTPSPEDLEKIRKLREAFSVLHALVEELAPASRERAVAITKLETAAMWSIKAVVCNDPNSEIVT